MNSKKEPNIHENHRERMYDKYLKNKLQNSPDHEILELLLFYAYPRVDTNEKAHILLNQYGSLKNLFDASTNELMYVRKLPKRTAILLSLMAEISNRFFKQCENKVVVTTSEEAAHYLYDHYRGKPIEEFCVVSLDSSNMVIHLDVIDKGTVNETYVSARQVVEAAISNRAVSVILAHNHPAGSLKPSKADKDTTANIVKILEPVGIKVVDHIIVCGESHFSFKKHGFL